MENFTEQALRYNVVLVNGPGNMEKIIQNIATPVVKESSDNILYKGYVMSDYNKHKQRTAVRNLREYIKETTENPNLDTEILEVGDGLAITKLK